MLIIRLSRTGKINAPSYRLVVADKKRAVKGKYLDILGYYNPISEPKVFQADKEKIEKYLKVGAQMSVTALNLLCDHGILPKNRKIKIKHAKTKAELAKNEAEKEAKAEAKVAEEANQSDKPTNDDDKEKNDSAENTTPDQADDQQDIKPEDADQKSEAENKIEENQSSEKVNDQKSENPDSAK